MAIFQIKNSDIFHISAQNIDCGYSLEPPRRGRSNEYPQSMFLSRNNKNNVYPCKPQFYYIKVGFKGVKIIKVCFRDVHIRHLLKCKTIPRLTSNTSDITFKQLSSQIETYTKSHGIYHMTYYHITVNIPFTPFADP